MRCTQQQQCWHGWRSWWNKKGRINACKKSAALTVDTSNKQGFTPRGGRRRPLPPLRWRGRQTKSSTARLTIHPHKNRICAHSMQHLTSWSIAPSSSSSHRRRDEEWSESGAGATLALTQDTRFTIALRELSVQNVKKTIILSFTEVSQGRAAAAAPFRKLTPHSSNTANHDAEPSLHARRTRATPTGQSAAKRRSALTLSAPCNHRRFHYRHSQFSVPTLRQRNRSG